MSAWHAQSRATTTRWSNCSSTCRRPSAAPARTRSPPIATTSTISPRICALPARSIAKADTDDLRGFLKSLDERGFAASSLARRLSATRQLYRFLYAEGKRGDDPAAVLEGPKRALTLPKILSIAEVDRLMTQARANAENAEQPKPARLRAARLLCLLEVVYATGLRVSELVALPASAARRDQKMLVVLGKGNKERLVPLNGAAKTAMAEYLALRAEASADGKARRSQKRNGCFRPSASRATSPASISPVN